MGTTSDKGRVFAVFYITFGFVVVYGLIAEASDAFFARVAKVIKIKQQEETSDADAVPSDDADIGRTLLKKKLFYFFFVLALIVSGGVIMSSSEGWTTGKGIYWAWQTMTTIGYGDCFLHKRSRIIGAVYALLCVAALASCLNGLSGAEQVAKDEKRFRALLRKELSLELIEELDENGDGVDRAEFLMGMLVAMGCASHRECQTLLKRFEELDTDRSGKLTREDMLRTIADDDDDDDDDQGGASGLHSKLLDDSYDDDGIVGSESGVERLMRRSSENNGGNSAGTSSGEND